MSEQLKNQILEALKSPHYRHMKPRSLANELGMSQDRAYQAFKAALRQLLDKGLVSLGKGMKLVPVKPARDEAQTAANASRLQVRGAHAPATADGASPRSQPSATGKPVNAENDDELGDIVQPHLLEGGRAVTPAAVSSKSLSQHASSPNTPAKAAPAASAAPLPPGVVVGTYRQNKRGFGFVMATQPVGHEDVFIAEEDNLSAITGDIVRVKITGQSQRDGKTRYEGRIMQIEKRSQSRFVGSLAKRHGQWVVLPDGNTFTQPILAPDAGSRHIKPGTKVVIELTTYPSANDDAAGVITDVLGEAGQKDVDLRAVIVQHNLPEEFDDACRDQARAALDRFNSTLENEISRRVDLRNTPICTIDPDDAKDYDDAISLERLDNGNWELGVHIADVSFFVEPGSPLDVEAAERGNSVYFPGYVIPMLPEVLSNGVCSLQEGVPRLCKTAFIELNDKARPVRTRFANTVIKSAKRMRYREAQAILDGQGTIPHPDGDKTLSDYSPELIRLLTDMRDLALRIQARRNADGQIVLALPEVELLLDEEGKVIGAVPEDQSFTHTLIEMFMVEANEAVARLLDGLDVPFLRRIHPEPEAETSDKLRQFALVAGHRLPKVMDRPALQQLLAAVKDRPEAFAINLAVLRSMARAEYSPRVVGHYALASEHYGHFTSPIRRYADLTIHRLLDAYFTADSHAKKHGAGKNGLVLEGIPTEQELVDLGKRLSFTERRGDEAENELRQVKILELLKDRVGEIFKGVVTGVARFGVFVQLADYLIDGLVRYEDMADDWWEVDERSGTVRGRRTGERIAVGDMAEALVVSVDVPRRELTLAIQSLRGREAQGIRTAATAADDAESARNAPARSAGPGKRGKPDKSHRRTKVTNKVTGKVPAKVSGQGTGHSTGQGTGRSSAGSRSVTTHGTGHGIVKNTGHRDDTRSTPHRDASPSVHSAGASPAGKKPHRKGKPGGPAFGNTSSGHFSGKPATHRGKSGSTVRNQRSKKRGRGK